MNEFLQMTLLSINCAMNSRYNSCASGYLRRVHQMLVTHHLTAGLGMNIENSNSLPELSAMSYNLG